MEILHKDGVNYLPYDYGNDENKLERMFIEHYEDIFGEDCIFLTKKKIKTRSGIGTIPDGFVLSIDDRKWYIIEVELESHPLHEHIIAQITKFNSAMKNTHSQKKLIKAFYEEIKNDLRSNLKFQLKGITTELYKFISECLEAKPEVAIIINHKSDELNDVCDNLPFTSRVIEFKTYYREKVGIGDHIHKFDVLREKREILPSFPIKKEIKEVPIVKIHQGYQTLMQILEVSRIVLKDGKSYNYAVKLVAGKRNIAEATVRDKCTRRLGINTYKFNELLSDKNKLLTFLTQRFPTQKNIITEYLEGGKKISLFDL